MVQPERVCREQEKHPCHLCEMKKKGMLDEIREHSQDPAYVCHNCNAVADRAEDLCNPGALPTAR